MLNSREVLYNRTGTDEAYTPVYAIPPLLPYLPKDKIIWCPFDKEYSNFVKILKAEGYKVIYSHIDNGKDFFEYEPEQWDIIVSNPPFKNKREFFERALSFNKPFALLMTNTWLNDAAPKQLFLDKDLQLLMFDKRINYLNPDGTSKGNPTFSSSYYCYKLLPKQIIMKTLLKERGK